METSSLKVAGASRPHFAETENGDAWVVHWHGATCRVAVIDGLGHGPQAAAAADLAVKVLESHMGAPPDETIRRCHAALGGTRGVVMGVASIDTANNQLVYAAVGNTDAVVEQSGKMQRLISYRGIVGSVLPAIRSIQVQLSDGWRLLMHTDGVMDRVDLKAELQVETEPVTWVEEFLTRWARTHDDATVVLVSG